MSHNGKNGLQVIISYIMAIAVIAILYWEFNVLVEAGSKLVFIIDHFAASMVTSVLFWIGLVLWSLCAIAFVRYEILSEFLRASRRDEKGASEEGRDDPPEDKK